MKARINRDVSWADLLNDSNQSDELVFHEDDIVTILKKPLNFDFVIVQDPNSPSVDWAIDNDWYEKVED